MFNPCGKRIKNEILTLPIEPRLMDTFPSCRKLILLEQMRNTGPCSKDKGSETKIGLTMKYDELGHIFWCFDKDMQRWQITTRYLSMRFEDKRKENGAVPIAVEG